MQRNSIIPLPQNCSEHKHHTTRKQKYLHIKKKKKKFFFGMSAYFHISRPSGQRKGAPIQRREREREQLFPPKANIIINLGSMTLRGGGMNTAFSLH